MTVRRRWKRACAQGLTLVFLVWLVLLFTGFGFGTVPWITQQLGLGADWVGYFVLWSMGAVLACMSGIGAWEIFEGLRLRTDDWRVVFGKGAATALCAAGAWWFVWGLFTWD